LSESKKQQKSHRAFSFRLKAKDGHITGVSERGVLVKPSKEILGSDRAKEQLDKFVSLQERKLASG